MKKTSYILATFMAAAVMAMSPQRMWATPGTEISEEISHICQDADNDGICDDCKLISMQEPVTVTSENYKDLGLDQKYIGYKAICNRSQFAYFAWYMGSPITFAKEIDYTPTDQSYQLDPKSKESLLASKQRMAPRMINVPEVSPYKYVLVDDIVINENLLDEDGMPNDHVNGQFRDDLYAWKSLDLYQIDPNTQEPIEVVFDGNNHSISGLYQNEGFCSSNSQSGMAGFVASAGPASTICNLGITDSYFGCENTTYAAMATFAAVNFGTITNCWSDATVHSAVAIISQIGGIAGVSYDSLSGCSFSGLIVNDNFALVGGVVPQVNASSDDISIENCHFSGTAINNAFAFNNKISIFAGVIGYVTSGDGGVNIDKCYADGKVINNGYLIANGIAYSITISNGPVKLTNCYNAMTVSNANNAKYQMCGIAGRISGITGTESCVKYCFSYGKYSDAMNYTYTIGSQNVTGLSVDCICALNLNEDLNEDLFASGQIAWGFNYNQQALDNPVWYQQIGKDKYPVLTGDQYSVVKQNDKTTPNTFYNDEATEYTLEDGKPYDAKRAITFSDLSYKRTFIDNDFNCLYVPFSVAADAFEDCDIYAINMFQQHDTNNDGFFDDNDELTLEVVKVPEDSKLIANHPYLIKYNGAKVGKELTFDLGEQTIEPAEENIFTCSSMYTNYKFAGTYSAIPASTLLIKHTLVCNANNETVLGPSTTGIKAQRWYMTMTSRPSQFGTLPETSSPAKSFRIAIAGDETTAIKNIGTTGSMFDKDGKYLSNGQIVILKNGKKYNVNGQIIR